MTIELLIVIIGAMVVVAILIFVIRSVVPVTPFLYANARMQARAGYLISDQKARELAEAKSLKELANMLRDTDYSDELDRVDKDNLLEFHTAVEEGFLNSVKELKELSPKVSQPLFDAYLMFLESKVLKTIYRQKFLKVKANEKLLFPVGIVTESRLRHLLDAETIADMRVVMEPTLYSSVFAEAYDSMEKFEITLDNFVLNYFVDVVRKTKMFEAKAIIAIKNQKIDILNIIALLKLRIRNVDKENQLGLLIDNRTPLSKRFNNLIAAEKLTDFVKACKGLQYHDSMSKALEKYEKDGLMLNFENELLSEYKDSVVKNDLHHTLGPYPLFSYLLKKEIEQRNLFIISRLIEAKFSAEKIKEMIT